MINRNAEKIISHFKPFYVMNLLLGAFGAAIIIAFSTYFIAPQKKQKKIVTIHITKIVSHFVQNEVNKNVSKEVLEQEVKAYALALEEKLKVFAQAHHLIVLPKEAVIAGIPDYTEVLLNEFNQKQ